MKIAVLLVVAIAALAFAKTDEVSTVAAIDRNAAKYQHPGPLESIGSVVGNLLDMKNAVAADMGLKLVTMEDGTPEGKCYCSCNLNNQPVFMELGSSNLVNPVPMIF